VSRTDDVERREKFWRDMSAEVGEEILHNALLRVLESEPENLKDQWLLFFASAETLYYKRFPNDSAMARLFNMGPKEQDYPVEGQRWDNLTCRRRESGGFLSRLLKTPATLELRWDDDTRFMLELDRKGEVLFQDRLDRA